MGMDGNKKSKADGRHLFFFCRAHGHRYNLPKLEGSEKDDNVSIINLIIGL